MKQIIINNNKFLFRSIDFIILAASFLIACIQFENTLFFSTDIYLLTAVYSSIAFILVRFSKHYFSNLLKSSSDILKMACGNACGLFSAIVLFSLLALFIPNMSEIIPLAIISSLASFFIMGTVVPAIKRIIEVKSNTESFKAALF